MSLRPDEVSDDPLHAANEIIRLERERDAIRAQLEEAREGARIGLLQREGLMAALSDLQAARSELGDAQTVMAFGAKQAVGLARELQAARDRIGALEGALQATVDHVQVPLRQRDNQWHADGVDILSQARAALAPAPGTAPTREETTTGPCGCPLHLGLLHAQQGCPKERRLARVDPFDMPGKGEP